MGVYDTVVMTMACPACGALIVDFQTKSGPQAMMKVSLSEVSDAYASCASCGVWIEMEREPAKTPEDAYYTYREIVGMGFEITCTSTTKITKADLYETDQAAGERRDQEGAGQRRNHGG